MSSGWGIYTKVYKLHDGARLANAPKASVESEIEKTLHEVGNR